MKTGAIVLILLSACARAETLTGHVVGISDGDTVTVLADRQRITVQIEGIDAPEIRQTFGQSARRSLSQMVFQKDVRLECRETSRIKPKICKVWVQPSGCPTCGMTLDVGYAQVVTGMAWWLREHAKEQSEEDRGRYESAESEARERHRGLWSDLHPVPPWEWRRQREQPAAALPDLGSDPAKSLVLRDFLENSALYRALERHFHHKNWRSRCQARHSVSSKAFLEWRDEQFRAPRYLQTRRRGA